MADLSRIGVAIDSDLLDHFDKLIESRGYTNRSEAFRDLIRNELIEETWQASDSEVFGTVTLVYDHHVRQLTDKLTELQHEHFSSVIANMHVHLDHHNCLEVILIRGKSHAVQKLANAMIAMKGVKHGRLTATAAQQKLV